MRLLSTSEISHVSGAHNLSEGAALSAMEHYSFMGALLGGGLSGIYGLCTNHTITTTVGATMTMTSSFINVFWIGLGVSWLAGAAVGLAIAQYNAQ
ncbi:MAG: hypothetical protein AB7V32_00610 [Candidatus Berkiella sp.]